MGSRLDPQFVKALEPLQDALSNVPQLAVGDVANRRAGVDGLLDMLMVRWPEQDNIERRQFTVQSGDHQIPVHQFIKKSRSGSIVQDMVNDVLPSAVGNQEYTNRGSAVFYCHGGGYFSLSVEHYRKMLEMYVSMSGVTLFAPDYRLAPEHPFPVPHDDCYTALTHIIEHASDFDVDPSRIAVYGDSAGGGLAAGLCIRARDENLVSIKQQMLVGAMLDDRVAEVRHEDVADIATWTDEDNITGWKAYCDKPMDSYPNPVYASPGRCTNYADLPALYLEVPELDIFRQESEEFGSKCKEAGVKTEVHVWPGVPHSFEMFAHDIDTAKKAIDNRVRVMKAL